MTRTSKIRIKFTDGSTAETIVRTISRELTRDEQQEQHDAMIDAVVDVMRYMKYAGTAPLRAVEII